MPSGAAWNEGDRYEAGATYRRLTALDHERPIQHEAARTARGTVHVLRDTA